jgi:hypothetical protein
VRQSRPHRWNGRHDRALAHGSAGGRRGVIQHGRGAGIV